MVGLCQRFGCLPRAGGLLDQDVDFLRMINITEIAGTFRRRGAAELDTEAGGEFW